MYENNAMKIRRELLIRIARLMRENKLQDEIDRIPLEMAPRQNKPMRCCIHHDRAVLKYRTMALLGLSVEDEADELTPLAEYAETALEREKPEEPILTVIDEACSACVRANYFVTNACRGCLARPCMMNCPRKAISMQDGQAQIDTDTCVNCGLCMKVCPYHAIIYVPIPCEEACPVGAISKCENGREKIDYSKCIFCGKCLRECPFGAIMEKSQIIDVLRHLASDRQVIAMMAPAIVGQFPGELEHTVAACKELGFDAVVEVASGADKAAADEAAEFAERMKEGDKFMTTSCCTAYVEAVRKHIDCLSEHVSETPTPLHYTAAAVKETWPDAVRVFIGPCVAKRKEAIDDDLIDYAMTVEELGSLFVAADIDVATLAPAELEHPAHKAGRGFPISGGVTGAVKALLGEETPVEPVLIDGLTKQSLKQLRLFCSGKCPGNFVEVMACEGGCLAGPGVISNPKLSTRKVEKLKDASK